MKLIKFLTWTCFIIIALIICLLWIIPELTLDKIPYDLDWIGTWIIINHGILAIIFVFYVGNKINKAFKNLKERNEKTNN